jgi:hypothetical protein
MRGQNKNQGIFINNDSISYNEFMKSRENKKREIDRIDRLELLCKQLQEKINSIEQSIGNRGNK